jgi:hypothetical protein
MEADEAQLYGFQTPQQSNSFKRPRRSLQSTTPLSSVTESVTSSPRHSGQNQFAPQLFDHVNALKHLDDQQILQLLSVARNGGQSNNSPGGALFAHAYPDGMRRSAADRSSMSTVGSRASSYLSVPSSRVPSMMSDPRSSIASTDSSFTHYSAASSRLSTASSNRLSTISTASTPAPKNFACTFCDKALKSKPYWKSHEEEFHEQRLTWRCPDCEQIFHAGKRFREHHTKLHVSLVSFLFPAFPLTVDRAVSTASNLGRADNPLAGKHRHASRSTRSSCTTRTRGVVASVLLS